ncbi:MAG: EndoU domain-containing protein [Trebonia sp.]
MGQCGRAHSSAVRRPSPTAGTGYPYPGWGRDRRRPPVRSRQPGKTEFPENWDEDKIIDSILSVARSPDSASLQRNGRWLAEGRP